MRWQLIVTSFGLFVTGCEQTKSVEAQQTPAVAAPVPIIYVDDINNIDPSTMFTSWTRLREELAQADEDELKIEASSPTGFIELRSIREKYLEHPLATGSQVLVLGAYNEHLKVKAIEDEKVEIIIPSKLVESFSCVTDHCTLKDAKYIRQYDSSFKMHSRESESQTLQDLNEILTHTLPIEVFEQSAERLLPGFLCEFGLPKNYRNIPETFSYSEAENGNSGSLSYLSTRYSSNPWSRANSFYVLNGSDLAKTTYTIECDLNASILFDQSDYRVISSVTLDSVKGLP